MFGWLQLLLTCTFSTLPPSPPPFSWDTIPLFIHAQNQSGLLNETAAKYMATFPIATVEKAQDDANNPVCNPVNGKICEEDRIIQALKQIRSYSDETRTIFYLNSLLNFPQYNLSTQFLGPNKKYLLHDQNGKLIYLPQCSKGAPNETIFDLSYNETINFWLQTVEYAMTKEKGIVDGIFADRCNFNISSYSHCINITKLKQQQWNQGHIYMLEQAQKLITSHNNERGILIGNNANIHGVNARMFENFRYDDAGAVNDGTSDDLVALMNETNVRISEVHGDKANYGSFTYNQSVSAYLIGAYNYSYYACTKGWTLQSGWDEMWQNPDYKKNLGQPLTHAIYDNKTKIYSRQFKSGTKVYLDLKWQNPCIKWSDGTITGNYTACNKY